MMSLDPLKTVISIGNIDDTSLAVPSLHQCRSGQQRVLEQVQTIRRTRSRPSSSSRIPSSPLSPTGFVNDSVFDEPSKSQSTMSNGSVFISNGFSKTLGLDKSLKQQVKNSKDSTVKRNLAAASLHYERCYGPVGTMPKGHANTSRSEPDLLRQRSVPARPSVPMQRFLSNRGTYRTERQSNMFITSSPGHSVPPQNGHISPTKTNHIKTIKMDLSKTLSKPTVTDGVPKCKVISRSYEKNEVADISIKEAVEFLSNSNEVYQHCGASYIQHNTFIDNNAKEEVLKLKGIPPLVSLLRSPNTLVSQTASAALRNLSFKSDSNKEAIHRSGGIAEVVALLQHNNSVEIQKQLTGLLWNLSSADSLKPDLLKTALPVLMERVVLPYTAESTSTKGDSRDPEVFYHATGFLRNLSSAKQHNRQTMRKSQGLVDSMVKYVQDCVETGNPDDKSLENCVCVLHNLTFQLEAEAPALFSRITALAKPLNRTNSQGDNGPINCFSPQAKSSEKEYQFDFPVVEDPQPTGAGWLFHSKTLQSYLDLLGSSEREDTRETCCGVLQNLTAHEGIVSRVMSQIIVQKLNGLQVLTPLMKSNKVNLQKNTLALVGNLAKNPNLHNALARKALPELVGIISTGTKGGNESDDTLSMACQTANCLFMKEPEMGKRLLNGALINSLRELSQNNYFPKSSKAASMLLYNLWSEKDLQSSLKKQGMIKSSFVNQTTTSAMKALHVVD
ncbi:plakophilin-1 isoform X2 [Cynoglossus semilaevis]|uniref:Plakophilin 1 n=1 Tax=Cynoglossus semilaevis TaxID=244447 RepID=A0A3P8WFB8_CYNSE|nr:plakophilin-1-like isoform X2 [Cynoglossus semilaevis]